MGQIKITIQKAKAAIIRIVPSNEDKRIEATVVGMFFLFIATGITLYASRQPTHTASKAAGRQTILQEPSATPTAMLRMGGF